MKVNGQLHPPAALLPGKEPLLSIGGGWLGPTAGLDTVAKRKIPSLYRESNPDHPTQSLYRLNETS